MDTSIEDEAALVVRCLASVSPMSMTTSSNKICTWATYLTPGSVKPLIALFLHAINGLPVEVSQWAKLVRAQDVASFAE